MTSLTPTVRTGSRPGHCRSTGCWEPGATADRTLGAGFILEPARSMIPKGLPNPGHGLRGKCVHRFSQGFADLCKPNFSNLPIPYVLFSQVSFGWGLNAWSTLPGSAARPSETS